MSKKNKENVFTWIMVVIGKQPTLKLLKENYVLEWEK